MRKSQNLCYFVDFIFFAIIIDDPIFAQEVLLQLLSKKFEKDILSISYNVGVLHRTTCHVANRDGKTYGRCGRVRAIFFLGCANSRKLAKKDCAIGTVL